MDAWVGHAWQLGPRSDGVAEAGPVDLHNLHVQTKGEAMVAYR